MPCFFNTFQKGAITAFYLWIFMFVALFFASKSMQVYIKYNPECSHNGDGSITDPFCSIDDALNQFSSLPSGDTSFTISFQPPSTSPNDDPTYNRFNLSNTLLSGSNASLFFEYTSATTLNGLDDCSAIPAIIFDLIGADGAVQYSFTDFYQIGFKNINLVVKRTTILDNGVSYTCLPFQNAVNFGSLSKWTIEDSCLSGEEIIYSGTVANLGASLNIDTSNSLSSRGIQLTGIDSLTIASLLINGSVCSGFEAKFVTDATVTGLEIFLPQYPDDTPNFFTYVLAPMLSFRSSQEGTTSFQLTGSTIAGVSSSLYYYLPAVLEIFNVSEASLSTLTMEGNPLIQNSGNVFSIANITNLTLSEWSFESVVLNTTTGFQTEFIMCNLENITNLTLQNFNLDFMEIQWQTSISLIDNEIYGTAYVRFYFFYISITDAISSGVVNITGFSLSGATIKSNRDYFKLFEITTATQASDNPILLLSVTNLTIDQSSLIGCTIFEYKPQIQYDIDPFNVYDGQRTHTFDSVTTSNSLINNCPVFIFTFLFSRAFPTHIEPEKLKFTNLAVTNNSMLGDFVISEDSWHTFISNDGYSLNIDTMTMSDCTLNQTYLILASHGYVSNYIKYSTFQNNVYWLSTLLAEKVSDDVWDSYLNFENGEEFTPVGPGTGGGVNGTLPPEKSLGISPSNPANKINVLRLSRLSLLIYSTFTNETLAAGSNYIILTNPLVYILNNNFQQFNISDDSLFFKAGDHIFTAQNMTVTRTLWSWGTAVVSETDRFLFTFETGDVLIALSSRLASAFSMWVNDVNYCDIFHEYRFEYNTFSDFQIQAANLILIENFEMVTSGTLLLNNTFENFQLIQPTGCTLIKFSVISRVEASLNTFSNIQGEGVVFYITELRGERRGALIENVFDLLKNVGVIHVDTQYVNVFKINKNTITNSVLTRAAIAFEATTLNYVITVSQNTFQNLTFRSSDKIDLPANLLRMSIASPRMNNRPGTPTVVMIEGNSISFISSEYTRFYSVDASLLSISYSTSASRSNNIMFGYNSIMNISVAAGIPLVRFYTNGIQFGSNYFSNLTCSGEPGAIVIDTPKIVLTGNQFSDIRLIGNSEALLRVITHEEENVATASFDLSSNVFTNFHAAKGSAILITNVTIALYLDFNMYEDCYVASDGGVVHLSSVTLDYFSVYANVINYAGGDDQPKGLYANVFLFENALPLEDSTIETTLLLDSVSLGDDVSGCLLRIEDSNIQLELSLSSYHTEPAFPFFMAVYPKIPYFSINTWGPVGPFYSTYGYTPNSRRDSDILYSNFTLIKGRNSPNVEFPHAKISVAYLTIEKVNFTQGSIFEFDSISFELNQCVFSDLVLNTSNTNILRVIYSDEVSVQGAVTETTFQNIIAKGDSSNAFYLASTASSTVSSRRRLKSDERRKLEADPFVEISLATFSNISSERGPALLIGSTAAAAVTVSVTNSTFQSLSASDRGGAIWLNTTSLSLYSSMFDGTKAVFGGNYIYVENEPNVVISNCYTGSGSQISLSDVSFGPSTLHFSTNTESSPIVYEALEKNSSTLVSNTNFLRRVLQTTSNDTYYSFLLRNVTSHTLGGIAMSVSLASQTQNSRQSVFDETPGILKFYFYLTPNQDPVRYTINNCSAGVCTVNDQAISLSGKPGEIKSANMVYQSERFTVSTWFLIEFRNCTKGEIYSTETQKCIFCNDGLYALNGSCVSCPNGATCRKGVIQNVWSGYWRNSTDSLIVLPCNDTTDNRCLGENTCSEGFTGILCKQCDVENGFLTKAGDGFRCNLCPDYSLLVVRGFFYFVINIVLQVFSFRVYLKENEKLYNNGFNNDRNSAGPFIRLLTTVTQLITIIMSLNLDLYQYFEFENAAGSQYQTVFFTLSCLILKSGRPVEDIMKIESFLVILSPAAKFFIVMLVVLIRYIFNKKRNASVFKKWLLFMTVGMIISEHANIIGVMIRYLSCSSLDSYSGQTWMVGNRNVQCGTEDYNRFRNVTILPGLMAWAVLLPAVIFYILWKNRKKLRSHKLIILGAGMFYRDFKNERFYWGVVMMFLKSLIYMANSLLFADTAFQGLTLVVIFYLYFLLLNQGDPYVQGGIFKIERWSIKVYLFTLFLLVYTLQTPTWVQIICLVLISISNVILVGALLLNIIGVYKQKLKPIIAKIKAKIRAKRNLVLDTITIESGREVCKPPEGEVMTPRTLITVEEGTSFPTKQDENLKLGENPGHRRGVPIKETVKEIGSPQEMKSVEIEKLESEQMSPRDEGMEIEKGELPEDGELHAEEQEESPAEIDEKKSQIMQYEEQASHITSEKDKADENQFSRSLGEDSKRGNESISGGNHDRSLDDHESHCQNYDETSQKDAEKSEIECADLSSLYIPNPEVTLRYEGSIKHEESYRNEVNASSENYGEC